MLASLQTTYLQTNFSFTLLQLSTYQIIIPNEMSSLLNLQQTETLMTMKTSNVIHLTIQ